MYRVSCVQHYVGSSSVCFGTGDEGSSVGLNDIDRRCGAGGTKTFEVTAVQNCRALCHVWAFNKPRAPPPTTATFFLDSILRSCSCRPRRRMSTSRCDVHLGEGALYFFVHKFIRHVYLFSAGKCVLAHRWECVLFRRGVISCLASVFWPRLPCAICEPAPT